MKSKKIVPTGVKVLSILNYVYGGFMFLFGIIFLLIGIYVLQNPGELEKGLSVEDLAVIGSVSAIGPLFVIFAILFILMAVLNLVIGFGLWKAKNWARLILLFLSFVSVFFSAINLIIMVFYPETLTFLVLFTSLLTVGINVVIIMYLRKKEIREFFSAKKY